MQNSILSFSPKFLSEDTLYISFTVATADVTLVNTSLDILHILEPSLNEEVAHYITEAETEGNIQLLLNITENVSCIVREGTGCVGLVYLVGLHNSVVDDQACCCHRPRILID